MDVEEAQMLLSGINHVALLTADTERLCAFYTEVFGAEVEEQQQIGDGGRLTFVRIGPTTEFNVFQVPDNAEASRQVPMFGRGRLDHFGLQAASVEAFDEIRQRLVA